MLKQLRRRKSFGYVIRSLGYERKLENLRARNVLDNGMELIPNLVVDPEYIEIVKKQQEDKIREVHTELAMGD